MHRLAFVLSEKILKEFSSPGVICFVFGRLDALPHFPKNTFPFDCFVNPDRYISDLEKKIIIHCARKSEPVSLF